MSGKFIAIAPNGNNSGVKGTFAECESWAQNHLSSQKNTNEIGIHDLSNSIATVKKVENPFKTEYVPHYQKEVPAVEQLLGKAHDGDAPSSEETSDQSGYSGYENGHDDRVGIG